MVGGLPATRSGTGASHLRGAIAGAATGAAGPVVGESVHSLAPIVGGAVQVGGAEALMHHMGLPLGESLPGSFIVYSFLKRWPPDKLLELAAEKGTAALGRGISAIPPGLAGVAGSAAAQKLFPSKTPEWSFGNGS